jgi:hypothetical protein
MSLEATEGTSQLYVQINIKSQLIIKVRNPGTISDVREDGFGVNRALPVVASPAVDDQTLGFETQ